MNAPGSTDAFAHAAPSHDAAAIWQAGVKAIAADTLVRTHCQWLDEAQPPALRIGTAEISLAGLRRLRVIGAGKAGAPMLAGLWDMWQQAVRSHPSLAQIELSGLVSVPAGTETWAPANCPIELAAGRPAGVNEPTQTGVQISRRIMEIVEDCDERDGCLMLLSGGGSALLPLPRVGLMLEDKLKVIRHLSAAGADIEALNVVRKQLSGIKGGKLAAACKAGWLITLVISDVLGDPLDIIASGPTVPDRSTPRDALKVLAEFDPTRQLPSPVYQLLEQDAENHLHGSPGQPNAPQWPEHHIEIIGNNPLAVDAAGIEAEHRGYSAMMRSHRTSEGTAEEVGVALAEMTLELLRDPSPQAPNCIITGGEPVVKLAPNSIRGLGGRNQQLVLAAWQRFAAESPETQREIKQRVTFLSGGTDGEDGPTDAAGGWLDGHVWDRAAAEGLDIDSALERNDAYPLLSRAGGLLKTGPTGTNVCDLRVVTIKPAR